MGHSEEQLETTASVDASTADATATTAPEHDRVRRVVLSGLTAPRQLFSQFDGGCEHPEVEFEVPEIDAPEAFEPELPRIGQKKRLALVEVHAASALEHWAEAGRDAKKLKRGPPPEAPGAWTWAPPYAPRTEAVAEAATEAAPYELPAWPFAPLAPPATANTRAAAAELIHNVGWPVPPGLFLDQNGSREW
jgi:hypothetical protein